ncbi:MULTISPECIES: YciI family protein [unclassified Agromyces]|uniref:YciI family protein n=1 Tax=unclassified Agromyces TaxID=2639701 RepID=UPI0030157656
MEYALFYAEGDDAVPYVPEEDRIGEWVDDLTRRGVSEYGERLRPEQDATTVRVRGGEVLVVDGPFSESKEAIGGFDVIDARDLDEAIEIASKHPAATFARVEIRPFVQWPGADPASRVVPDGFAERPAAGRRYLMLVVAEQGGGSESGSDDDPEAWVDEMDGRGVRLFGEVLRPPADATFVRRRHGEVLVTDGGFAEAKEWVAGFDLVEVRDLSEAIEVAAKHPMARGGAIELRPLWPFDVHDDHVARAERESAERGVRLEPAATEALAGAPL